MGKYDKIFIDTSGVVFTTPQAAIDSNQANESSMSRGASGGCTQSSSNLPPPSPPPQPKPSK